MSKGIQKRAWTLHSSTRPSTRQWETLRWCSGISYPKHKGLKITLTVDTYEQKVWMMRQPTTLNAEGPATPGTHLSEKMETGEP